MSQKDKEYFLNHNKTDRDTKRGKAYNALNLLEAALYVSGRPLNLKELCSVLKTRSINKTRKLIGMLIKDYSARDTALEILELTDERYVLQLKKELTPLVRKLIKRPLLSIGPLKTLAYIAYKQPVSQKNVAEMRGGHAYSHIKHLKKMKLITSEKKGRSVFLRTTEYFADFFGLSLELVTLKRQLRKIFPL
jgi:segregation and condensation protein B